MSQTTNLGGAFLSMLLWRPLRNALYRAVGLFKPGWRRALVVIRICDAYADRGTMNVLLYSDPRFDTNLRSLEIEIQRLRRGGEQRVHSLPHDFPPGAQDLVRSELQ